MQAVCITYMMLAPGAAVSVVASPRMSAHQASFLTHREQDQHLTENLIHREVLSPAPEDLFELAMRRNITITTKLYGPRECVFHDTLSIKYAVCLTFAAIAGFWVMIYFISAPRQSSSHAQPSHAPVTLPELSNESVAQQPDAKKGVMLFALDGLRVIFITNVIWGHYRDKLWPESLGVLSPLGWPLVAVQHPSMSFFMILSGFIRMHTAKCKDYDRTQTRHHMSQVFARFCPAYHLALALTMVLEVTSLIGAPAGPTLAYSAFPVQALFLQSFLPVNVCAQGHSVYFPFQGLLQGWFTADVVFCAVLFPLLYTWRPDTERWGVCPLIFLCFVTVACYGLFGFLVDPHYFKGTFSADHFPCLRLLEFAAGMLSAQIAQNLPSWALSWSGWGWVFDCTLLAIFVICQFWNQLLQQMSLAEVWLISSGWAVYPLLDMLWCVLMVASVGTAMNGDTNGLLVRILGWSPLTSMAKYSFGAYIYQFIPYHAYEWIIGESLSTWWFFGLCLLLAWMLAVASEKLMEGPVRCAVNARMKQKS